MKLSMKYVILYVNDFEKSMRFYRDILQLPVKGEHGTYVEFDTGFTTLSMNTRESFKEITGLDTPEAIQRSQTFELGFVTSDVAETIEKLRRQGVEVIVEPVTKPWGQTVAYVADPDGHYIEICSAM
ncbi:VOC family protein [Bacillus sp. BGMRC 2118]|nr:VOC family protein [Bacillus sp. BGMRC 2118]